jgi:hypothetical protein
MLALSALLVGCASTATAPAERTYEFQKWNIEKS